MLGIWRIEDAMLCQDSILIVLKQALYHALPYCKRSIASLFLIKKHHLHFHLSMLTIKYAYCFLQFTDPVSLHMFHMHTIDHRNIRYAINTECILQPMILYS